MARKPKQDWAALRERIPVRWRPDPRKRGGAMPSKKLYRRKTRSSNRRDVLP